MSRNKASSSDAKHVSGARRSLAIGEWPDADRQAWEKACRPGVGLRRGGAAGRYGEVSRDDFAARYGAFLGFLQRGRSLDPTAAAAAQVTPAHVDRYVAELNGRVQSVTAWNCIYKLRMAARLLDPKADFSWLAEIEKDLALLMVPRSKFDRLVLSDRLVEAGLTLIAEAENCAKSPFDRAKGIRNGLLIALLAVCPIRIRNFAALETGLTFKEVDGNWWIALPFKSTKTKSSEERPVPELLNHAIDLYLKQARPVLIGTQLTTNFLWISSTTGQRYTTKNLGTLISKITFRTVGVDVSPHLFRTAAATTAAMYGGSNLHLASAVLGHSDSRVTYRNYIRATTVNAAKEWGAIVRPYLNSGNSCA
jgi:integrase